MRVHTITTKPPVGGRGRTKRTVAPGGILALSLAVALLAATASTAGAHTLSKDEARHETRLFASDRCETTDVCKSYEVTVCSRWGRHDAERHHAKCEFTLYLQSRHGARFKCRLILGWWLSAGSDEIFGPERIRLFTEGRQGCVDGW